MAEITPEARARAQRLKERRKAAGLSMEKVANALELDAWQTVQNWEKGKGFPNRDNLPKVVALYRTTRDYLEHGTGPAEVGNPIPKAPEVPAAEGPLLEARRVFQAQLLKFFWGMSDDHRDELLQIANNWYAKDNPQDNAADPRKKKSATVTKMTPAGRSALRQDKPAEREKREAKK